MNRLVFFKETSLWATSNFGVIWIHSHEAFRFLMNFWSFMSEDEGAYLSVCNRSPNEIIYKKSQKTKAKRAVK